MAKYKEGDRVRIRDSAASVAPPDYVVGKTATVEVVLDADSDASSPQLYRIRVDRFPDEVYREGMRRHQNVAEDWLELAEE